MNLIHIQQEYKRLEKEVNQIAGQKYELPLSEIEGQSYSGMVLCTVTGVNLHEDTVELSYIDKEDGEEMLTFVTINKFSELIETVQKEETQMISCDYKGCEQQATTEGTVFARNPEGGKDIPTTVNACDKHTKVSGFFENKKLTETEVQGGN